MENVGDGEVVAEGGDDEGDGGKKHGSEDDDAGTARGLAQPLPVRVAWKEEGDEARPNE